MIATDIGNNREIHPGTAISACARLSGSLLFRSFNLSVPDAAPGNVILSELANDKGPILINILGWMLENTGATIDKEKMESSPKDESKIEFIDCLNLLQGKAVAIMKQYNLSYEEMAYSCAMATAFIIQQCKNNLAVESGFNTAIYGFIEGTKTQPPELNDTKSKKKKWFKFWQ